MVDIQENVIITITRKPPIYLGPNNLQLINDCGNLKQIEIQRNDKQKLLDNRKKRLNDWYNIDNRYSYYTIEDFDDYLDGMNIDDINQRKIEYKRNQELYYDKYLEWSKQQLFEALDDKEETNNTISIPIYELKFIQDYEKPWYYSDTVNDYSFPDEELISNNYNNSNSDSDSDESDCYDN